MDERFKCWGDIVNAALVAEDPVAELHRLVRENTWTCEKCGNHQGPYHKNCLCCGLSRPADSADGWAG